MRNKAKWCSLLLLGPVLLLGSLTSSACSVNQERQQVYDFLTKKLTPIMEEINGLTARYNEITQIPPLVALTKEEEMLSLLHDLRYDTETVKIKIVGIAAPQPCREVRDKMIQLLELMLQAQDKSIAYFDDYDINNLEQANKLAREASELITEIADDIYDICQEYDIEYKYPK
ncbi:MAG: hypothetical protein COT13_04615 [Chloroflexi bacterium CG08_land_8_20_14_0_20_45_12]|nr:MAG: hypothetical protein COT13_04615 [Chloroflexi bacterium CG08_land_8_20_14_0_20_45_12]